MTLNTQTSADGSRESGSLVIFTRVEGLLRDRTPGAAVSGCDPLRFLAGRDVPLVLVSAWDAPEVLALQREVSFQQPFICQDGAALHVPRTWLVDAAVDARRDDDSDQATAWEVFRFSPPSVSAAFKLVTAMFLARGHDPLLTVGIGCDLADYTLLAAVDIPIVVRTPSARQPDLIRQLPGVFVTSTSGAAGWSEAVLGVSD